MTSNKVKDYLLLNSDKRKKLLHYLHTQGISNETLTAMDMIPREYFLKSEFFDLAYEDKALPIDWLQTISQPFTVGFMTDLLNVSSGTKVLEVGTGSCYQALILNALGASVYTIERIADLHYKSLKTVSDFGATINCFLGDGSEGLAAFSPFDRIIVTAGAPYVSENLKNQLAIGGIMVIPVGDKVGQIMQKITKISDQEYQTIEYDKFRFVPLIGNFAWSV